jgi:cytidylate kinase
MSAVPVLTIDGPSGSGKGTLARRVAERLGWKLLDSGALYRLLALAGAREGLAPFDEEGHAALAGRMDIRFASNLAGDEQIFLENEEVSRNIRTETAGEGASRVAAMPRVRTALTERQRQFAQLPGLVADGRDMGTVIFPTAQLKIFLTASAEERARRRYKQLKDKGFDVSLAALSQELAERDRRDANRAVSPLKPADDAELLDSTGMSIEQVEQAVLTLAKTRQLFR